MFQKLITSSIKHKFVVGFLTISLIVWGLWSLATLPFDSTPDITDNQVQVITQAPSLGAQSRTICNHSYRDGIGQYTTPSRTKEHFQKRIISYNINL